MIDWYLGIARGIRGIRKNALRAASAYKDDDEPTARIIQQMLKDQCAELRRQWEVELDPHDLSNLARHIGFGDEHDFVDILNHDLPAIEQKAEDHFSDNRDAAQPLGFEDLLHPYVAEHATEHYQNGHFRDAVLNAFIAVYDLIRKRTGIDMDGARLVGQVFSLRDPQLILSELETESGRNDQTGFLDIFKGAYTGIRNPKAHSLSHDLTDITAAQYLIFASLLARRVEEASTPI